MATLPLNGNVEGPPVQEVHKTDHRPINNILQQEVTETSAPVVTDVSPPAGPLPTLTTPSAFTVQDVTGLAKVAIWIKYPSGIPELVYDGTSFSVGYGGSTVVTVTPTPPNTVARRFTLVRAGGWPANPDIEICAVDPFGNLT